MAYRSRHPNLIPATRERLLATGKPFVIENVENVRRHLRQPIRLCGTMFGLNLWRHRYFEIHPFLDATLLLTPCCHIGRPVLLSGSSHHNGCYRDASVAEKRQASECHWMMTRELDQAIPPVYTEWIGGQLLEALR